MNAFQFGRMVKLALDAEAPIPSKIDFLGDDHPYNMDNIYGAQMRGNINSPTGSSNASFMRRRPLEERALPYGQHRILGQDPDHLDRPNFGGAPLPSGSQNYGHPQFKGMLQNINNPGQAAPTVPYPIRGAGRTGAVPALQRSVGLAGLGGK